MKKLFFLLLIAILVPMAAGAQEAYAALSDGNTALTFYYDDQKAARNGMDIGPFTDKQVRGWDALRESITSVVFDDSFAGCTTLTSTAYWFYGLQVLSSITGISNLKTDNVTDMRYMFWKCSGLKSLDVSGFKTDNVESMEGMFGNCYRLTSLDLKGFKTDNVRYMSSMFWGCTGLTSLDVSGFKTGKVLTMHEMFGGCSSLTSLDVSGFKTDNVWYMHSMFWDCSGLTSLDVSGFKTDNVKTMSQMFQGCSSLTSLDLSGFKTNYVTNMNKMFEGCSALTTLDLHEFRTGSATSMESMFGSCSSLTSLDVSGFKTDNVTNMFGLFAGCSGLTSLDLSGFKTDNVTVMSYMFDDCSGLTTIYAGNGWNTANVTHGDGMFSGCTSLVGGAGTRWDESHTDHTYACIDVGADNPGYFTAKKVQKPYAVLSDDNTVLTFYYDDQEKERNGMDIGPFSGKQLYIGYFYDYPSWYGQKESITSVVFDASFANYTTLKSTAYWFFDLSNLSSITGISNLKTDNVTDMRYMFWGCSGLTSLDVSGFKTDNVTDMSSMFAYCSGLTTLDVSGFKTDNVTDMGYMFYSCSGLTTIYAGDGWSTANVQDGKSMFVFSRSLVGGAGTRWDESHTDYTYAKIDGGSDNPGYFTRKEGSGEKPEGDLNGDGKVGSADVVALLNVMVGSNKDKLADADLNHDGKVDVADLTMLVNMIMSQK